MSDSNSGDTSTGALLNSSEPQYSFLKYFDADGKTLVLRTLRCLYILWFLCIATTVTTFALGLTITFHPLALHGAFNWRVVYAGCNLLLAALGVGLGVAGCYKGRASLLSQSAFVHILLSFTSLLPFLGNLSVLLYITPQSALGSTPAPVFYKQLLTALSATGAVSAVLSLMCGGSFNACTAFLQLPSNSRCILGKL